MYRLVKRATSKEPNTIASLGSKQSAKDCTGKASLKEEEHSIARRNLGF